MPLAHTLNSRSSCSLGWVPCASSGRGIPMGLKTQVSAPIAPESRAAGYLFLDPARLQAFA